MKYLRLYVLLAILVLFALPAFGTDGTINIATFNMQNYGYGKSYCKSDQLGALTKLLAQYDLIALQEVMRLSSTGKACYGCASALCQVQELRDLLTGYTGDTWKYVNAGMMHRGSRYEYLLFLFRDSVTYLEQSGTVCSLQGVSASCAEYRMPELLGDAPVYAKFRSGNFDFILMDVHSPSRRSDTKPYNEELGEAFDCVQDWDANEQDVLMVGDFNDTSPYFDTSAALQRISSGDYTYDAIYIDSRFTGQGHEFSGMSGSVKVSASLSDHPLMWATFTTTLPDDD